MVNKKHTIFLLEYCYTILTMKHVKLTNTLKNKMIKMNVFFTKEIKRGLSIEYSTLEIRVFMYVVTIYSFQVLIPPFLQ